MFRAYASAIAIIDATDDTSQVLRFGSGVLLVQQQVLVTNAHIVNGPGRIRVRVGAESYSTSEVELLYVDSDADLAVLKLSKIPPASPTVRLRAGTLPDVGERVFAIGNPQGLERTFSEGVISGVRSLSKIGVVVQHTAPISPGSSGGALFDSRGELIGLTVAFLEGGQNLNFAIPAAGIAAAIDQAFDVPSDTQTLAAFAARTRKRFPGIYDKFDDQSLISRFRSRYPALGAAITFNSRPALPPQLYTFVQGIADVLDEYNRQAGNVDISASPGRVAELQALNRRRLTRLRLIQPPTAKAREAADLLIAGFGETERRFEYYTSPAIPSRSPVVDLNLLRNEVQYSADGFAALVTELAPYKDSAPELFAWAQESFDGSSRLLEKLSSAVSQQSTSPPSIVGTWSDVGGTFTNRIVRTPEIRIADRSAGGFVIVPETRGLVEGFNFLLTGNASIQNGRIAADLIIGFYLKLSDGNEACNRKATLELEFSGKDLLVGTARFSALDNTGVRSQTFGAVCTGLPSGTKQVKLQRVR